MFESNDQRFSTQGGRRTENYTHCPARNERSSSLTIFHGPTGCQGASSHRSLHYSEKYRISNDHLPIGGNEHSLLTHQTLPQNERSPQDEDEADKDTKSDPSSFNDVFDDLVFTGAIEAIACGFSGAPCVTIECVTESFGGDRIKNDMV